ncbi:hypothetical protein IW262DRAFT_1375580 [Armillaria fumosa]|nr:hypothetical protein IW262DRAFT_1375580 [Armillaria fumosa]
MIWCCWIVWGRRRLVVLLPILSLISAIASRTVEIYSSYINVLALADIFLTLYLSFNLVTTLSCTLLIIYRIVAVTSVRCGAVGRLGVYHRFIEVLVESSALISIPDILYLTFTVRNDLRLYYIDVIVRVAKGIAPTLLVGWAAAGHTRPRDDSDESTVSSLHFQMPSELGTTSSQLEESSVQSSVHSSTLRFNQSGKSCLLNKTPQWCLRRVSLAFRINLRCRSLSEYLLNHPALFFDRLKLWNSI